MRFFTAFRMTWIGMLIFGITGALGAKTIAEPFVSANQLYRDGQFAEAAAAYEKIAQGPEASASLYYNWGNALIKSGQLGRAILAYEKALAESPRDPEIRANLQYARSLLSDKTEDAGLTALFEKLSPAHWLAFGENVWIFLILYWLGSLAALAGFFLRHRHPFVLRLGLGILAAALLAGATLFFRSAAWSYPKAIVLAKESEVRYGPVAAESAAFTLHEGSKVKVLRKDGEWIQIYFAKGKVGWVPAETLGKI